MVCWLTLMLDHQVSSLKSANGFAIFHEGYIYVVYIMMASPSSPDCISGQRQVQE